MRIDTPDALAAQRALALERANEVRSARAHLKRQLKAHPDVIAAKHAAADLLEHPPDLIATMRVDRLLAAGRMLGPNRIRRYLRLAAVRHGATVASLSDRQRQLLADALRACA